MEFRCDYPRWVINEEAGAKQKGAVSNKVTDS